MIVRLLQPVLQPVPSILEVSHSVVQFPTSCDYTDIYQPYHTIPYRTMPYHHAIPYHTTTPWVCYRRRNLWLLLALPYLPVATVGSTIPYLWLRLALPYIAHTRVLFICYCLVCSFNFHRTLYYLIKEDS